MIVRLFRRRRSNRFIVTAAQRQAIDVAALSVPPDQRHSFLLRVGRTLQVSAQPPGFVTDAVVNAAIAKALAEVAS